MKISEQWLRELVPHSLNVNDLSHQLTMAGQGLTNRCHGGQLMPARPAPNNVRRASQGMAGMRDAKLRVRTRYSNADTPCYRPLAATWDRFIGRGVHVRKLARPNGPSAIVSCVK